MIEKGATAMTAQDVEKVVELNGGSPLPGGADFKLLMPAVIGEDSFAYLREFIEFRRKCMNQGFDNLLEVLAIHERQVKEHIAKEAKQATGGGA